MCENCGKETDDSLCDDCLELGYWIDPVGGLHSPNEQDPARMYE